MVFIRFKNHFDSCETLNPFYRNSFSSDPNSFSLVTEWQHNDVAVATVIVDHTHEDYREFMELCLLFLDNNDRTFNFYRPGAVHEAR